MRGEEFVRWKNDGFDGEANDDFYSDALIDRLAEEDEISTAEMGFMHGWLEAKESELQNE
jgi:hypothetical protein